MQSMRASIKRLVSLKHKVSCHYLISRAAKIFQMVEAYENKLLESWELLPEYFITSSINDIGKEEMLSFIAHHNQSFS